MKELPTRPDDDVPLWAYVGISALIVIAIVGGLTNGQSEVIAQETAQLYEERGGVDPTGLDGGTEAQEDVRAKALFHYLRGYHPGHRDISDALVRVGDRWGVDPYLLMAIYVIESSAGRHCFNGQNCLGYGNYAYSDVLVCFTDVSKALAGHGVNGGYYSGKSLYEKITTYNSVNPAYFGMVERIMNDIASYE